MYTSCTHAVYTCVCVCMWSLDVHVHVAWLHVHCRYNIMAWGSSRRTCNSMHLKLSIYTYKEICINNVHVPIGTYTLYMYSTLVVIG